MELQELHDQLLLLGCNRFYIDGIGGPQDDDVEILGYYQGNWEIYYSERGTKGEILFSSPNKNLAMEYYYNHVSKIEHWHLVLFTRFPKIFNDYKIRLEEMRIKTIQNDIPHYKLKGDYIFRLFVTNSNILKCQEIIANLPLIDEELTTETLLNSNLLKPGKPKFT